MNKLILILITIALIAACQSEPAPPTADQKLAKQTEQSMQEASRQVGYPAIKNFQEKKLMKLIYELRDREDLICYAYLYNRNTGRVGQFLGKTIGYGIPYSTQFSNPQKAFNMRGDYGQYADDQAVTIGQPEPNGLFMPDGLSATWLIMIDPETKEPRPVYVEPEIIVSPFKLHKD